MILPGVHSLEMQPFSLLQFSECQSQEKYPGLLLTLFISRCQKHIPGRFQGLWTVVSWPCAADWWLSQATQKVFCGFREFLGSQDTKAGVLHPGYLLCVYPLTTLGKYSQSLTQSATYAFPIILIEMINSNEISILPTTWEFHEYMKFYVSDLWIAFSCSFSDISKIYIIKCRHRGMGIAVKPN